MIPVFPPPVTELLDRANDVYRKTAEPQDLKPFLQDARDFHDRTRGFFLFFNKSRVEDEEVKHLTEVFLEHCDKLDKHFNKLDEFIKKGNADILLEGVLGVQEASHNMTVTRNKLKEINQKFEVMSSLPIVEDFIRIGINVFNGVIGKEALVEKMPFQLVLLNSIERDIRRFKENYPEAEDLAADLSTALERMKSGIGAVQTYMDNNDKRDLLNGLNILGVISWELCEHLDKMGSYMGEKGKSEDPYISDFLIAAERFLADEIDPEDFKVNLAEFKDYFINVCNEIGAFQSDFMIRKKVVEEFIPRLNEKVEDIQGLFQDTEEALGEEEPDKGTIEKLVKKLQVQFEELEDCKDEFYDANLIEKDLSKEPDMIKLRDIIKGLFNKIIPVSLLQETLLGIGGQNQVRIERLEKCLSSGKDEKLQSLKEPLYKREHAFGLLQAYVDERNLPLLFEALELIEETYDSLAGLDELLSEKETAGNMVACFKCSHLNTRGSKACSKCGAKFPFSSMMETQSTIEVGEGQDEGEEREYSDDVIELKKLVGDICQGRDRGEDLKKVLEMVRSKISGGKKQFREFTKPYLEKFPDQKEFKEKADRLSSIFDSLETRINNIEAYFSDKNISYLKENLEAFLDGVTELNDFDKVLEEMLKKKKTEDKKKK